MLVCPAMKSCSDVENTVPINSLRSPPRPRLEKISRAISRPDGLPLDRCCNHRDTIPSRRIGYTDFYRICIDIECLLWSYLQEAKAEEAMKSLKKLLVSHCVALRDGTEHKVSTDELVTVTSFGWKMD